MDFKVSYLDPGLTQSYLCDSELPQLYASRMSRRYKTQLRDFLSTCRTKKNYSNATEGAYNNYNNVYPTPTYPTDNSIYMQQNFSNLQTLYPPSYIPTDNLFHYRQLGSYYTDYMTHGYVSNGYVDAPRPCLGYETTGLPKSPDQKIYSPQIDTTKYQYKTAEAYPGAVYGTNTVLAPLEHKYADLRRDDLSLSSVNCLSPAPSAISVSASGPGMKEDGKDSSNSYSNDTRQTVLMWGPSTGQEYDPKKYTELPPSATPIEGCKWAPATPTSTPTPGAHSTGGSPAGEESPQSLQHQPPPVAHTILSSNQSGPVATGKMAYGYPEGGEVWPHQYYPYHPSYHTSQVPSEHDEEMQANVIVTSDPGTQPSDITVAALS